MFIDKIKIKIKAGKGGNGAVSFHTEKFVPRGGPDGGDGGKGGDIVFLASNAVDTLNEFHFKKHFRAFDGENGASNNCYGRSGKDFVITVPTGTIIRDTVSGRIMADFLEDGERKILIKGGAGGKGNAKFATSRRQAPGFASHGEDPCEREVELELKVIADVGLVGFPNVGKSTLLSVVSNAKPKIADYHFTTLHPNLGIVKFYDRIFVAADIPGLIENASQGSGLGHRFLKHIERTRMIIHVIDMGGSEGRDPIADYETINRELFSYSEIIASLPQIICANKMDMPDAVENLSAFKEKYPALTIIPAIAPLREGLKDLLAATVKMLDSLPPKQLIETEFYDFEPADKTSFEVIREDNANFLITGGLVDNLARKVSLDDPDSLRFLQRTLKKQGVIDALKQKGAKTGATVFMGDIEFEYTE